MPPPPSWNPEHYARRRPYLEVRQRVIAAIRAYFDQEGFASVDTPCLQVSPGNEVHLQAFSTELRDPRGGEGRQLYLHTSPEFSMKKLLVAGESKLYQLAHAFRNAERSSRHHPEFTMLEWYRAHSGLEAIMTDCERLVRACATTAGKKSFIANGMSCDPFLPWRRVSVPEAFWRYAGIDLLSTTPNPLEPDTNLLRQAAKPLGIRMAPDDSWEALFFRIMMEKIEPFLGKDCPTVLCDYPISMAALARPTAKDPRLADRFELYLAGYEIANAFNELTDANEQRRRFEADMALKESLYGERFPIDEDFLAALAYGMPPASGIALGVDRLVMLCAGVEKIEEILWLPVHEGPLYPGATS